MRVRHRLVAALLLALHAGCVTGPGAGGFGPARSPRGIDVQLRVRRSDLRGELLEVRDSALVLLETPGEGVLVPFREIRRATFRQMRLAYDGGVPSRTAREAMRRVSRFPQGLPPAQLERLLASRGQRALRLYKP